MKKTSKTKIPKTILLTGVPGVGKTTLAEKISSHFSLPIINFGDILFDKIKAKKLGINHVDDIRLKLKPRQYHSLQLATAKQISRKSGHKIITSHLSIDTPFGFMPGFPISVLQVLNPTVTFIVEAPLEEISLRRLHDTSSRKRNNYLEQKIDLHQSFNRSLAAAISLYTGNYVFPINNQEGNLEESFAEIENVLTHLLK